MKGSPNSQGRLRKFLIAAVLICLSGCITFERTSTGDFDYEERLSKAIAEILEQSKDSEQEILSGKDLNANEEIKGFSQRHFEKADELVLAHTIKVKNAIPFVTFNDYLDKRKEILKFTVELKPSLVVVDSENTFATAFPSGTIVVSSSLVKSLYVDDGYSDAFLGILMHELAHVRDGHAIEQWATADGRNEWVSDKTLGTVAEIASIIPFLNINYDVDYGVAFKSFKELPELSEYAADLAAIALLEDNGFRKDSYIGFLEQVNGVIKMSGSEVKEPFSWLNGRVECLGTFSDLQFDDDLTAIVIGSEKDGDSILQTLDLRKFRAVFDILDEPAELRNYFAGYDSLSDEQLREQILSSLKKNMFTICSIRNVFSNAKVKNGVMTTPGFDVSMFGIHY